MDLSKLDKDSYSIIRKWNLDNLEYVLSTVTNEQIKNHSFWFFYVPFDGLSEILSSLVYDESFPNTLQGGTDAMFKEVSIDYRPDPLSIYRKLIQQARAIEKEQGVENILLKRYVKWCLWEQQVQQNIYTIKPTKNKLEEFLSNETKLRNSYGNNWRQHYRPVRAA